MPRTQLIGKSLAKADLPPKVKQILEPLTVDERRFAIAYCDCRGNASVAVVEAGLKAATDTLPARASLGTRLARRPGVRAAIQVIMEAHALTGIEITAAIKDTAEITAFPFYEVNKDGKLRVKEKMEPADWEKYAHWVKEITTDENGNVINLKLHDSYAAKRDLAKIAQLYSDAPIFQFNTYLQTLSDEELLRRHQELTQGAMRQLPSGQMVAEIPAPGEGS